jgi:hypothetical protein
MSLVFYQDLRRIPDLDILCRQVENRQNRRDATKIAIGPTCSVAVFPFSNPEKKYPELALKAAEAALKVEGDGDPEALFNVAEAYAFLGDMSKAGEYGQKAVAASIEGAERKDYEEQL